MGLQTVFVQYVLYSLMAISLFLVQPYFLSVKSWVVAKYASLMKTTVLKQIFYGLFFMIFIMFLDSSYRWKSTESLILIYQCERNFYLGGFTLFLMILFNKLCSTLEDTYKAYRLNKDYVKQRGFSMDFIGTVAKNAESEKLRNQDLVKELESLKAELKSNRGLISEIENNKRAYSKLKSKYEALRNK